MCGQKHCFIFAQKYRFMNIRKETLVCIETPEGNITVKLYDDTPLHRDNFLKLVEEGTYDGLIFHRVIKGFMIQGGDPESENAPVEKILGAGDLGYTLPAEFVYPKLFHKRGALSAARTGDEVNPEKRSSASQFYIVWGEVYKKEHIKQLEKQRLAALQQKIFGRLQSENREKIMALYKSGLKNDLQSLKEELIAKMELETEKRKSEALLTPDQVEAYTTLGGTPHLDNEYTVFGEVTGGFDVIERIQSAETNRHDRPLKNITMKISVVEA